MNKDKALQSVNQIKELMEQSSKFTSISGLTAILAGIYSLAGSFAASRILSFKHSPQQIIMLALAVLFLSAITAYILSWYKAKRTGQKLLSKLTYRIAWNFSIPLLTGGLFCIALVLDGKYGLTSSVMLLFYGLSLVNVSKYTFSNVGWLGYAFLVLGITDSFFDNYALLCWTIGFGAFHIIYGILFYLQYEREK